jgi:hypothetical protein
MPLAESFNHLKSRCQTLRNELDALFAQRIVCEARVDKASTSARKFDRLRKTLEPDSEHKKAKLNGDNAYGPGRRTYMCFLQHVNAAKDEQIAALRHSVAVGRACKRKREELDDAHAQYCAAVQAVYNAIRKPS